MAPELVRVTDRYFARRKESQVSAAARDPEAARRLYEVSLALTGAAPV